MQQNVTSILNQSFIFKSFSSPTNASPVVPEFPFEVRSSLPVFRVDVGQVDPESPAFRSHRAPILNQYLKMSKRTE